MPQATLWVTLAMLKAVCRSYSTAALRHIVLLPEWFPSFISRSAAHTKRRERPLLAKEGTIPRNLARIRNSRKLLGSLTCRKSGTWDRFFYFPSGGRHVEDFYVRKIQLLRPGLKPQIWVPEASMLTTRPPKPSSQCLLLRSMRVTFYVNDLAAAFDYNPHHKHSSLCDVNPVSVYIPKILAE